MVGAGRVEGSLLPQNVPPLLHVRASGERQGGAGRGGGGWESPFSSSLETNVLLRLDETWGSLSVA